MSDKNGTDSLTPLIGAYVIDIMDPETDESQEVILLCNMEEDELTSDPGFDFSDDEVCFLFWFSFQQPPHW